MATESNYEFSAVANLPNLNDFKDVEIEEIRHVEYIGPYVLEPEEFVELVLGMGGGKNGVSKE